MKDPDNPPADSQKFNQEAREEKPVDVYPLTGLPADHLVDHRPFGVMINNAPQARPQSGVFRADIVYEVLAEGAVTRFLALFQSNKPDIIGPVRSARPYYVKLNNAYDAIYVHHGWSPQAKAFIQSTETNNINGLSYDGSLFQRVDFRQAPHNSYISYENMVRGAEDQGYELRDDLAPMTFLNDEEVQDLSEGKADNTSIDYLGRYQVRFTYQPGAETYVRSSDGKESADRETNTPITVSNVLIIEAPHRYIDSYPRREIDLQNGGKALLLQKGGARQIEWKNENGRIVPVKNGETVGFIPGQTWVNIVPADPGLDESVKVTGREESAN